MRKRILSIIVALSLIFPVMGIYGSGVYAASNTKSGTASDIVAVATAQKDGTSGSKYIKWFWNDKEDHAWCAAFVSWCANQAGADSAIKKNGGCTQMYADVLDAGGEKVTSPKAGDLVFYHKNSAKKNKYCHVGIVTSVSGKTVKTVQGNVDNKVYNTIKANSYQISTDTSIAFKYTMVYVRPNYNGASDTSSDSESNASTGSSTSSTPSTSETSQNINGSTFNIINKASGKALDVYGSNTSSTNKSNVDITALNKANKSSQFKFTKTSKGWYNITPVSNSKLAVNPFSNTPKNGTNVNVYTKDASDKTQGWTVEKKGDYYLIRSAYNKSLVLTAAGTDDHSNVKLATYSSSNNKQLWSLVSPNEQTNSADTDKNKTDVSGNTDSDKVTDNDKTTDTSDKDKNDEETTVQVTAPVSGKTYFIKNKASGKALDVYGDTDSSKNKSNVQIYTLNKKSKSSQFKITKTSGGWYSITPASNSKLAVNPYSDTPAAGTNVNVYTKDASDKTQGWIFEKSGDYYIIRSAYKNSLVLAADGTGNMSNVELAKYSKGNSKQLWSLTEV